MSSPLAMVALAALAQAMGYELDNRDLADLDSRLAGRPCVDVDFARREIRQYAKENALFCTLGLP